MLMRIINHESRVLRRDQTVWVTVTLFAVCIGFAVYNGAAWTRFQARTINEAMRDETARYDALRNQIAEYEQSAPQQLSRFSDPRDAAAAGRNVGQRFAFMPGAPLAPLSIGQSDLLPFYFKVSTRSLDSFTNADEIENPSNLLAGRFDAAFVIIYLMPLLIFAVSYNLLSSEKENGTLQMLLAQPTSLKTFVVGKIITRFALIISIVLLCTFIALILNGVSLTQGSALWRFGWWTLGVTAYALFWFAIAGAVNACGWKSSTNAIALAGVWLLFVVIVPALLSVAVNALYPMPSRVELINESREASSRAASQGNQLLARYYEDHPELVQGTYDASDAAARTYIVQQEVEQASRATLARYDEQLQRQQNLVARWRYLSPAVVMQEMLNDVSGTSHNRHQHFLQLVETYHQQWQGYFIPRIFQKTKLDFAAYDAAPRFSWQEENPGDVTGRFGFSLAILILTSLVITAFGIARLHRYNAV